MRKVYNSSNIYSIKNRIVFFDTNIFLYLFWATGKEFQQKEYAKIFLKLLKQNNTLAVDSTVISEIYNRMIKIEYKKHLNEFNLKNEDYKYKKFRNSEKGKEALEDIVNIIKEKILSKFSVIGREINKKDINNLLINNQLDFSDRIIHKLCKENNCILLTNDRDFIDSDIEILTALNI